jgi:hypothetical protein
MGCVRGARTLATCCLCSGWGSGLVRPRYVLPPPQPCFTPAPPAGRVVALMPHRGRQNARWMVPLVEATFCTPLCVSVPCLLCPCAASVARCQAATSSCPCGQAPPWVVKTAHWLRCTARFYAHKGIMPSAARACVPSSHTPLPSPCPSLCDARTGVHHAVCVGPCHPEGPPSAEAQGAARLRRRSAHDGVPGGRPADGSPGGHAGPVCRRAVRLG